MSMDKIFLNLSDVSKFNDEQQEKQIDIVEALRKEHCIVSIFSIFEVLDFKKLAFEGKRRVYFLGRFNHTDSKEEAANEVVESPTWLELWKVADRLIRKQEEEYRTDLYVEDFEVDEDGDLQLGYGS